METTTSYVEPLVEKAEQYAQTSYELIKLKALHTTTKVVSTAINSGAFILAMVMAVATLTIGVALWLGDVLGKSYYGFFCITAFYALLGFILYYGFSTKIKNYVSNAIINQVLN